MRPLTIFLSLLLSVMLTSCASYDFSRKYVQQGNMIPPAKVAELKIGMSKEETAVIMGTSLLSPTFNTERWDYVYTTRVGSKKIEVRNLSLYFQNNHLVRIAKNF